MDETTNTSVEQQTADQPDAFLEGWNSSEGPGAAADQQRGGQEEAPAAEAATAAERGAEGGGKGPEAEPETTGGQEGAETEAEARQAEETQPVQWTVKHMGEERVIAPRDITPELLQKGMDYDRIREKYDEAKPVVAMFSEFARKAGMSVADYAKHIRAEAKKASGMSAEEATRAVELEDREAAVSAKEAQQQEDTGARERGEARVKADLAEFAQAFPQIYEQAKSDPKAIPQGVWDDVKKGMSLTAAYSRFAVAKANELVKAAQEAGAAAETNLRNAERSTGSLKSAGKDVKSNDPFLEGFGA